MNFNDLSLLSDPFMGLDMWFEYGSVEHLIRAPDMVLSNPEMFLSDAVSGTARQVISTSQSMSEQKEFEGTTARIMTGAQATIPIVHNFLQPDSESESESESESGSESDLETLSEGELLQQAWYTLEPNKKYDDDKLPSDIQKYLCDHADNSYAAYIRDTCSSRPGMWSCKTEISEIPQLAGPNTAALELISRRYKSKYGIDIYVITVDNLARTIQGIEEKITEPTFIGVVMGRGEDTEGEHLAPMVVFFNPPHSTQFLLMDVLGDTEEQSLNWNVCNELQQRNPDDVCCYCGDRRQADFHSCRIGAMTLLRNALLSLKDSKDRFLYWQTVFANGEKSVPSEWTYLEQIQPPPVSERPGIIAVRDIFSCKPEKRSHPKTVSQKRKEKAEVVTVKHRIKCVMDPLLLALHQSSSCPPQAPLGADLAVEDDRKHRTRLVLDISLQKPSRTYLARKGLKEQKRHFLEVLWSFGIETITSPELLARDVLAMAPIEKRNRLVYILLHWNQCPDTEESLKTALQNRYPFLCDLPTSTKEAFSCTQMIGPTECLAVSTSGDAKMTSPAITVDTSVWGDRMGLISESDVIWDETVDHSTAYELSADAVFDALRALEQFCPACPHSR